MIYPRTVSPLSLMCYTRGEQEFLSTFVIPGNIGELPRITKGGSNSRSPISSHIQELWQALICLDWQQYAEWKVLILISFIPNKFIWWQRLLKRAWVGVGTLFQTNFPCSIFCSIFLGLWCQIVLEAGGSGQRTTIQLRISETFVAQNEKEKERSPSAGESGQRTTI